MSAGNGSMPSPGFYIVGGTLKSTASSYIPRAADTELLNAVQQREFCYILTPRQMGKSSLMVRTAERLKANEIHSVIIDLTGIGTANISVDAWYLGQIQRIVAQLRLRVDYSGWWKRQAHLGAVQRFSNFLTDVVLQETKNPIAIFIDEIDSTLGLQFSSDDYFAAIRALYNERATNPDLDRLTFVLLGVASPSDLIKDTRRTPFNIGRRIQLTDFTEVEAQPLAAGLAPDPGLAAQLLAQVLFWSGGHPYLTQKTCAYVAQWCRTAWKPSDVPVIVDDLVREMFLSETGQNTDDNLQFIRNWVLETPKIVKLLQLYRRIRHKEVVIDNEIDLTLSTLKLSGLIKSVDGVLKVRNPIYERVFDESWIRARLADREPAQSPALTEREPRQVPEPTFDYDVFISYSYRDTTWVRDTLLPRLEHAGLRVCIDFRDFEIGVPHLVNMERAVDSSRYTLLIVTPAWVASEWTEVESLLVSTGDPAGRRRRLIPLLLRPTELPPRLSIYTYLDLTESDEDKLEVKMQRLLRTVGAPHIEATGAPPSVEVSKSPAAYDTGAIRQLLKEVFVADKDLEEFAYDYFRPLYERFAHDPGVSTSKKIQQLIEYVESEHLVDKLLDEVARINPRQYRRFAEQVRVRGPSS